MGWVVVLWFLGVVWGVGVGSGRSRVGLASEERRQVVAEWIEYGV